MLWLNGFHVQDHVGKDSLKPLSVGSSGLIPGLPEKREQFQSVLHQSTMPMIGQTHLQQLLKDSCNIVLLGALLAGQSILETRREQLSRCKQALQSYLHNHALIMTHS